MNAKNKYVKRSRLSESKVRRMVYLLSFEYKAVEISELLGINRNTVNKHLHAIRERIIEYCYSISMFSKMDIEEKMSKTRNLDDFLWWATDGDSEFYWYCKETLSYYRGIRKEAYHLYLGECCLRYILLDVEKDFYQLLLKILREKPLGS